VPIRFIAIFFRGEQAIACAFIGLARAGTFFFIFFMDMDFGPYPTPFGILGSSKQ
jgi:nicotinamide riboside transporter PnuC